MLDRRPELKERPEGKALVRVERILKEGNDGIREPGDVRDAVLNEVREVQKEALRPAAKRRMQHIERRLQNMERLRKSP